MIKTRTMPTERSTGSLASSFRTSFANYLSTFGTTITRIRTTETKDSMNRITATSTSSVTYSADIQWLTKNDLTHLNIGDVKIGDGMLFVEYNADIELHDDITFNSKQYRVTSQVEGEQVAGGVTYKGFIIRNNAQT